ncbi:MAG: SUF system NifU family Fe-S cluster assembly protein [Castellaniella sp.]|uniref:Fe-S cluster assembly sulfur transfer protein SufU n=1 Tax=Castellaniella sp. TaxID=1955812 RepID=UPI0012027DCC|nr:SUF system NifU family Fe-S cluster assembly protein [Castellaniella sp.]TAN25899.1 MAG: SUF system NifU family Fe-S cluster assembly protein [Castellaniella sp.]
MTIYKDVLLDHGRHPRNYGDPTGMRIVRRGRNPLCGDEVEVGIDVEGERLTSVRFRGRACAICVASASIMTGVAEGKSLAEALDVIAFMHQWLGADGERMQAPEPLEPLSSVRGLPSRRSCALLAWDALADAVNGCADATA